jgi:hypothetical protein
MVKTGDTLNDRSNFNLIEEDPGGYALLSDQEGLFYALNEKGEVLYAGDNELRAQIVLLLPQLYPSRE